VSLLRAVAIGLVPPLCAACGRRCENAAMVCERCEARLAGAMPLHGKGPPGIDRAWSSAPYEGVARDLVGALKFRRLLPVAESMADRVDSLLPPELLGGELVPVPPASLRAMRRGFDPAGEFAAALAERLGAPLEPCLVRRGGGRQTGKGRGRRIGRPPRIHAAGPAPRSVLLIDDVFTTGATLSACARALRGAGAVRIVAITFARRP
jgi:predicted amidophosphoribosyltransferase